MRLGKALAVGVVEETASEETTARDERAPAVEAHAGTRTREPYAAMGRVTEGTDPTETLEMSRRENGVAAPSARR